MFWLNVSKLLGCFFVPPVSLLCREKKKKKAQKMRRRVCHSYVRSL